jgi:hypothetical protein
MTSQEILTIIAAVGLVLTNLVTAWRTSARIQTLQAVTARTVDNVDEKVQDLKDTTKAIAARSDEKLDKIHELTNSNLSAVKTDLYIANERIAKLEALIQETMKTKVSEDAGHP